MTTTINPFIVSGKITPEYFCDRQNEVQTLSRYLRSEENVVLMSPRRMGKTKLIDFCFEQTPIGGDYITLVIDILHTTSFREFVQLIGNTVFEKIAKRSNKLMKLFTATVRSLSASFGYDPVQNTPTFDIRLGDLAAPDYTLKEIFEVIEKAGKRCLVVFDEFQQINNYQEKNVEALLRSFIQQIQNANFVFSGSQRRMMESMFFSEKRPFYMSARSIVLNPIEREIYLNFALSHFRQRGKDIEPEAIRWVYDTFGGVTLYLQRIMKDAFNITPNGECCDVEMVKRLVREYILESEARLREQLSFVSEPQKELLYAIHKENNKVQGITSAKFIKRHSLKSSSAVQAAAKKLMEYDIITRVEGTYSISDPLLYLWLKTCL